MSEERQTGKYLLLASIASVYSAMLALITLTMSWETWMIPLMVFGVFGVWSLHIGRIGSEILYENICAGVMLIGFFFFGVHAGSLFDMPAVACIMILVFSMLDRKSLIYITVSLYAVQLLYHFLCLHTLSYRLGIQDAIRLLLGVMVTAGAAALARYRINRRMAARMKYENVAVQLETLSRQNADFLSSVSHELRTPINMVIGISDVALEKAASDEVRSDIQSIQLAGKRLSGQINNILDYTEIVEGTLTPAKEEYMIISVLNDVITMTAMQGGRQRLEMVFDMDLKMPAVLIGDAEKISHVLKILLENSMKFTEEGGIYVCLEFRKESYGINLLIDIHDTGIGMSEDQLTKIYDDFYQADTGSNRFSSGLGLGIPIARGLLHSMDGFVHFESKGHQGLQVHITIPQEVADDTPCMTLNNPKEICIACYFRPDKYSCDDVRTYYDRMIQHLMEGLDVEGYQAHNFEGLLKLQRTHKLTHVFITQSEYEENRAYYEELAETLQVVVIAEREYALRRDSRLLLIRKPFFALSVVNLLNGEVKENGFEEAQNAGRKPFSCVGVRALAVDDEEMNLVVAKGVLESYGVQVDTCLSGREAVEMCRTTSYDIIFLDHMMPGVDGVETLRRIREINYGEYQDLPVIALTANTVSGAREMFRNEGFTEFVPKPIERAVLERVLRRVLPKSYIQYGAEPVAEDSQPVEEEVPFNPFDVLAEVGINAQLGLDYCCGDENFYLEMLRMFHGQSDAKKKEISSLYEAENWPDYAVKVHALKSTSLTIGAEKLSEFAKALERAGKKEDIAYIRENHTRLLEMYDDVCRSIAGF